MMTLQPGDATGDKAEAHKNSDQVLLVLEGELSGEVGEDRPRLNRGDVVVIPAGTGHQFTKIDDHIDYLMVRIDPDKATPIRDEAASQQYLKTGKQP
jgi:uncharacterized cupin superfamily protein